MGRLLFFDVESMVEDGQTINEPICVVAQFRDTGEEKEFQEIGCMTKFCEWLFTHCKQNSQPLTVIDLNLGGYDIFFILKWILFDGACVITINMFNLTFKDSYKYWPTALANLPSRFNLEEEKGFFPHKFNTRQNQNYVGAPLTEDYFSPDLTMDEKKYNDFKAKQLKYCSQDVTLLRLAGQKYRAEYMEKFDIDPCTMASMSNLIYGCVFMQENTIGIPPPYGYCPKDQQSRLRRLYLKWRDETEFGGDLMYMSKHGDGEKTICIKSVNAKVDGYDPVTKTIIQVHGCFWHGHDRYFQAHTLNQVKGVSMGTLFDQTQMQSRSFREAGFDIQEVWECKIQQMFKNNTDGIRDCMTKESEAGYLYEPLNPRDAFYGGRTEALRLYMKGQEMHYYDFTSLYPFVNKRSEYPKAHPLIYTQDFHYDRDAYFGLTKCDNLPPQDLYRPVLPSNEQWPQTNVHALHSLCQRAELKRT